MRRRSECVWIEGGAPKKSTSLKDLLYTSEASVRVEPVEQGRQRTTHSVTLLASLAGIPIACNFNVCLGVNVPSATTKQFSVNNPGVCANPLGNSKGM
jgi:hypothetical protein